MTSAVCAEARILSEEKSIFKGRKGSLYDSILYRIEVPENRGKIDSRRLELAVRMHGAEPAT